ncbi:MAG: type I-B CRISPR-associated endonuclease Cas1b [Patescibacteria group bacterium]|nr:type I-B CRISPR-associated endonuclease Cas1b [Patescibacteria group bacterium]
MKRNYYIFRSGRLKRKDYSLQFIPAENKKPKKHIPIEDIDTIYLFGEMNINTKLLVFLAQKNICLHVFNYYGFYSGSYYPREFLLSGSTLVKQVQHYTNKKKRFELAKEFVNTAIDNILRNLKYYNSRKANFETAIKKIESEKNAIPQTTSIYELMAHEGRARMVYYDCFNDITIWNHTMGKRVRRPPNNMMNCLISWGNSLLYTSALSEIYRTTLNPTISFLHEPGERRYSLSLDLSEVFKPLLVDKVIFRLINQKMITKKDFDKNLNYCYLTKKGRKTYLKLYEDRLKTTIKHRKLGRSVSYRRLIRLEAYKLVKHISEDKKYQGFRAWW